ncbi:MAG: hypothetical protein ACREQN_16755 [Candidatus Binataceae bacterium]
MVAKLRIIMEETRRGIMTLWGNDGHVSHEDSQSRIKLMGKEVLPRLREIAGTLDLKSPFELNTPVSLAETPPSQLTAAG